MNHNKTYRSRTCITSEDAGPGQSTSWVTIFTKKIGGDAPVEAFACILAKLSMHSMDEHETSTPFPHFYEGTFTDYRLKYRPDTSPARSQHSPKHGIY